MFIPLGAMVHKDLRLFFSDRRSVLMSFAVPIAIASFFGSIFSGDNTSNEPARIKIAVVDRDQSALSKKIVMNIEADKNFNVVPVAPDSLREAVRAGRTTVGVTIPEGFGTAATRAFFRPADKPSLNLFYDPSHRMELAMLNGILTQHVMTTVAEEALIGASGRAIVAETLDTLGQSGLPAAQHALLRDLLTSVQRLNTDGQGGVPAAAPGFTIPYSTHEEAITSGANVAYNGYAHSFAGMGIQFLLFAAANLGIEILVERQRGLWRRMRSAPISRRLLLVSKAASGAIIALLTLLVSFGFAMVVFGVRIHGSVIGFAAVAVASAIMASTFGLLVAALGRTPGATRGVTTFAVLLMVMLGGAWVPTFVFPQWLQQLTAVVPARWAVDGLDAMTWRGIGLSGAVMPVVVLMGFSALFWTIAALRFRWEE